MKKFLNSLLNFTASLNLAIFILAGMALLIILQAVSMRMAGAVEALPWLKALASKDFYHSGGFSVLLLMFCLNLLACSLKRLPKTVQTLKSVSRELNDDFIGGLPCVARRETGDPREAGIQACAAVKKYFKNPAAVRQSADESCFYAEKGRYGHLGFYFAHLSILLVVLGVMLSTQGYRADVVIGIGERVDPLVVRDSKGRMQELPFSLACEDHGVVYYPGTTQIKQHQSTLAVFENGEKVKTQTVTFAQPLSHRGIEIYQERFSGKIKYARLKVTARDRYCQMVEVREGGDFTPEGTETVFRVDRITPYYIQLRNSASPETIRVSDRAAGRFAHEALRAYEFGLVDVQAKEGTKLKAVRDPGKAVIWFAVIGMLGGFAVVFFLPHQQLWLRIRMQQGRSVMTLAGTTTKNLPAFEEMFAQIQQSCAGDEHGPGKSEALSL